MDRFDKYFKFNNTDVISYIKERTDVFDKKSILDVDEIGDGNINYVYRVYDKNTGKSIVVKQSDELLRTSSRPLDMDRNRIEAEVLIKQWELSGGMTPKVYKYDPKMNCIIMEDISNYKNLRISLLDNKTFPKFKEQISKFMVDTLLSTTDLVLDSKEKKDNVARFINKDLCEISEDLVFTEPYNNYKNRNIVLDENRIFVEENIYEDKKLKIEAAKLKNRFKNYPQALIHGDLHTGSIFINEDSIKVIDPEFAFYGPIGYDVGNVMGNLFFALTNAYIEKDINKLETRKFINWLEEAIIGIVDLFKNEFMSQYKIKVKDNMYHCEEYMNWYLDEIISDSAGIAGMEIIRRVIGDSKVVDITSIKDIDKRIKAERTLIYTAKDFILKRNTLKEGKDFINVYKKYIRNI